jgi:DNA-directed RNA polymerase subunit RPC12/RpoP
MQFKKVLSSLLVVILLLSLTVFSASASADSAFELAVEATSTADSGVAFIRAEDTIEVKIAIPEGKNPGVAYMMFDVVYNAEAFDLDEASINPTDLFVMGSPELDRAGVIIDEENGVITFVTNMLVFSNTTATGDVVTFALKAKGGVCAETKVEVTNLFAYTATHDAVNTIAGSDDLTVHNFTTGSKVAPTCTEDGLTTYTCSDCKVTFDMIDEAAKALGHNMSNASCTEDSACTRCGLEGAKATGHNYGDWVVEKEASEGVEGLKTRTCSNCGDKLSEKIPALAEEEKDSSATVVIIIIVIIVVLAAAGFCVYWFMLRKKK